MSFFSDALGHSGFYGHRHRRTLRRGAAISRSGLSVLFAAVFSSAAGRASRRTPSSASFSTAVAFGIFIVTLSAGGAFEKFNRYLIGDQP